MSIRHLFLNSPDNALDGGFKETCDDRPTWNTLNLLETRNQEREDLPFELHLTTSDVKREVSLSRRPELDELHFRIGSESVLGARIEALHDNRNVCFETSSVEVF
jgi:hypothetical protein